MSNILFVYERDMATVSAMKNCFHEIFTNTQINYTFKQIFDVKETDLAWLDILILVRPDNIFSETLAYQTQRQKKKVIIYMDDDLFNLPKSMPSIPWRQNALKNILKNSNLILSSSNFLCDRYKGKTIENRAVLLNTVVSDEEILEKATLKNDTKVKIVYAAGASHEELFEKYIEPILPLLDEKFGDSISLSFVGVHPKLDVNKYSFKVNYYESRPLLEYRKFMHLSNFDIGLSPLHDDEFSKCKYFNKYIEYTLVGVVGIYSKCEPYMYIVKDGYNGYLAENNPDDWYKKIELLVTNEKNRKTCYENALSGLKNEFKVEHIRSDLLSDIPEMKNKHLETYKKFILKKPKIRYKIYRFFDWVYLIMFYLKKGGISGVIKKMIFHFKEQKIYH